MSTERKSLDAQAYRSGNGIWTQLGKYSRVPEKLGFCTLSEVTEIQIFILLLWKEKAPQGVFLRDSGSFSSRIHKAPASPGWWLLSKGAFLLTSFPFATRMVPRKAWWQWLEQAAKVGRSSAVYPLSSK